MICHGQSWEQPIISHHRLSIKTNSSSSPSRPNTLCQTRPPFIDRPLCDSPLRLHALHHLVQPSLDYHAAHNHLAQHGMQGFEIEYQIELAHVLEQPIQRFDKDLDQIQQCERRFRGGGDDDEVERCVVAVGDEGGGVVLLGGGGVGGRGGKEGREGQEVAAAGWPGGDEREDLGYEPLLDGGVLWSQLSRRRSRTRRRSICGWHTSWV